MVASLNITQWNAKFCLLVGLNLNSGAKIDVKSFAGTTGPLASTHVVHPTRY
jgi:hypothetical protein